MKRKSVLVLALLFSIVSASVAYAGTSYAFDPTEQFSLSGTTSFSAVDNGTYWTVTARARSYGTNPQGLIPDVVSVTGYFYRNGYYLDTLSNTVYGSTAASDLSSYNDFAGGSTFELYAEHVAEWTDGVYLECVSQEPLETPPTRAAGSRTLPAGSESKRQVALARYVSLLGSADIHTIWDVRLGRTGMGDARRSALGAVLAQDVLPRLHRPGDLIPAAVQTNNSSLTVLFLRSNGSVNTATLSWTGSSWLVTY